MGGHCWQQKCCFEASAPVILVDFISTCFLVYQLRVSKFWKTYSGHYSGSKDGASSNFKRLLWRFYIAWYDSVRHGSVRLGLRFHCSLVPLYGGRDYLHVALPWLLKNLLILRRSIKLSLDPLLGYPREYSLFFLNRQRHFLVVKKVCSFKTVAFDPSLTVLI